MNKNVLDLTPGNLTRLRRALLGWYERNKRDLPWRRNNHPYHVWVSEIMLQQTRVAAVLDHYARFMQRFRRCRHWRRLVSRRCWLRGAGLAIIIARAACIRQQK